ncbi:hypothetical protein [Ammoniphilus sp. CFH 90114]|uniref:hypothetical protein n=1 Tax=Ammoniphilus sp. CFH 90114 TaxID=2493665 RepID=UPI00100E4B3C|nr:hypothetical protein [Ammoniphilus sp. CFH 90114]RXT04387.1 hypothetical protein EIZ39_21160 [Ammoniphilus sp. CFH 90114]
MRYEGLILAVCLFCLVVAFTPYDSTQAMRSGQYIGISSGPTTRFLDIEDLKPGDEVVSTIKVQNEDEINYFYTIRLRNISGSKELYNKFDLQISDAIKVLYRGSLSQYNGFSPRYLLKHSSESLTIKVSLPKDVGNEYQGLSSNVAFDFITEEKQS